MRCSKSGVDLVPLARQRLEGGIARLQLLVGAQACDLALLQHDNAIAILHCAEPVGDQDHGNGAIKAVDRPHHLGFSAVVKSAGGLIKNQQLGLAI